MNPPDSGSLCIGRPKLQPIYPSFYVELKYVFDIIVLHNINVWADGVFFRISSVLSSKAHATLCHSFHYLHLKTPWGTKVQSLSAPPPGDYDFNTTSNEVDQSRIGVTNTVRANRRGCRELVYFHRTCTRLLAMDTRHQIRFHFWSVHNVSIAFVIFIGCFDHPYI